MVYMLAVEEDRYFVGTFTLVRGCQGVFSYLYFI